MSVTFGELVGNFILVTGSVIVLLLLLKKFAWGTIETVLQQRSEQISHDIDGAEAARRKAEALAQKRDVELSQAKDKAGQIIDNAKEIGTAKSEQILAEAKEEASRLKIEANQDIAQSKAEALSSVKGEVVDLTVLLAEKIMTANLDKEAQSTLIDRYLDELGDA